MTAGTFGFKIPAFSNAISKIEQETKLKFKDTYEKVESDFIKTVIHIRGLYCCFII